MGTEWTNVSHRRNHMHPTKFLLQQDALYVPQHASNLNEKPKNVTIVYYIYTYVHHVFIYIYIYVFFCLSIYRSIDPSIHPSIYPVLWSTYCLDYVYLFAKNADETFSGMNSIATFCVWGQITDRGTGPSSFSPKNNFSMELIK